MISWTVTDFDGIGTRTLYEILRLRAEVFVVEQVCAYLDVDGRDLLATHLIGHREDRVVAYARWFEEEPGTWSLGRIVTHPDARGEGLGTRLMSEAVRQLADRTVVMHAQAHLAAFYSRFGFHREGEPFLEDGIPHVFMRRKAGEFVPPAAPPSQSKRPS
ncbi:MAG TPA: GNAT family N-acetyltransferase [Planctomycetes bacterium]|nr:GNAT family N-acetyltransferase [Planctomycetota bacterium]